MQKSMLRTIDVQITPLPFEGASGYVLNQVDRILTIPVTELSIGKVSKIISNLIEYILSEFVSPSAPDSVFSLYLLGGAKGVLTSRFSELADLCVKLQDLQKLHQRLIAFAGVKKLGRCLHREQARRMRIGLHALTETRKNDIKLPPLPFVAGSGSLGKAPSGPPSTKGAAPALPGSLQKAQPAPGKTTAPSIPVPVKAMGPGKTMAPSIPVTANTIGPGKTTAPNIPLTTKAPVQSLDPVTKGKGPSLPLGKGAAPSLPEGPSVPPIIKGSGPPPPVSKIPSPVAQKPPAEVPIFTAPKISDDEAETRKVHWQSLPVPRFRDSVFNLQLLERKSEFESANFDLDLVKHHFVRIKGIGSPNASPCRTAPTAASSPISSAINLAIPSVLETRRIQQIEIFLNGRKGLSASDVVAVLKDGGDDTCVDLLEAVVPLFPSVEERALLQGHQGKGMLGKADAFLIDLMRIPDFQIAANYVIVLHTAEIVAGESLVYFEKLIDLTAYLRESTAIPKLLKIIGSMVVYLWKGKRANLNGFSLEVIPQLKKVHSFKDKEFTLMNCIVDAVDSQDLEEVLRALTTVESLLELDYADTLARSEEVERSVRAMKPNDRLDRKYFPLLVRRLNGFKEMMEEKYFKALTEKRTIVRAKSVEILKYFAESDKKNFNEFLQTLHGLRVDLTSARNQNDKRRSQKRVD